MNKQSNLLKSSDFIKADYKQIKGLVSDRNILYSACKDVLSKFNAFEENLTPVLCDKDTGYINFIRYTLENAIKQTKGS